MNLSVSIQILKFWFGDDCKKWPEKEISKRWFMGSKPFDDAIRSQFGEQTEQILAEDFRMPSDTEELVATVLVLDQFTRNIYRGSAKAFSGDKKALALVLSAVKNKIHLRLPTYQRIFLFMPFEHSEKLKNQQTCVPLFEEMLAECEQPIASKVAGFYSDAKDHYQIIEQFGRFPHRNKILGRTSTPEEMDYLVKGKKFGQ